MGQREELSSDGRPGSSLSEDCKPPEEGPGLSWSLLGLQAPYTGLDIGQVLKGCV